MTTHWEVESSALVKSKLAVLSEVAALIGDPAVRNRGTIGGSLAHADPAADYPAAMIALGAEMVCEGAKGRRMVKVDDWFKGLMTTAVGEEEILVELRVPVLPASTGAAYLKFPLRASRWSASPPRSRWTARACARRPQWASPGPAPKPCAPRASRLGAPARSSTPRRSKPLRRRLLRASTFKPTFRDRSSTSRTFAECSPSEPSRRP